jgi:hypothetical protein
MRGVVAVEIAGDPERGPRLHERRPPQLRHVIFGQDREIPGQHRKPLALAEAVAQRFIDGIDLQRKLVAQFQLPRSPGQIADAFPDFAGRIIKLTVHG